MDENYTAKWLEDIKNFFTLMLLTKLYFYMVRVLFLHGINFMGKKNKSSVDATVEQAYNDVHLRTLYILADSGGRSQHWLGWENTTRWPVGVNCFPVVALLYAALSCFSLHEQLQDGNFSLRKALCYEFLVLEVSSHTRDNTGPQQLTKQNPRLCTHVILQSFEKHMAGVPVL